MTVRRVDVWLEGQDADTVELAANLLGLDVEEFAQSAVREKTERVMEMAAVAQDLDQSILTVREDHLPGENGEEAPEP